MKLGHLFLVGVLLLLQVADIVTTNIGITKPGLREGNPVMAWTQEHLGSDWWLLKTAIVCFAVWSILQCKLYWPLFVVVGGYFIMVAGNAIAISTH